MGKDVLVGRCLAHFVLPVREVMTLRRRQILRQKWGTAKQYKDQSYCTGNHVVAVRWH